jgi:RNA polymerase sigma-70 factor (ECF subfamily)
MRSTRESLLERVRDPSDSVAWEDFFAQYAGPIQRYAQRRGLDVSASSDVLQETMVELIRVLPKFRYDVQKGRFRSFVLTIAHRRILATWRRQRARRTGTDALAGHATGGSCAHPCHLVAGDGSPDDEARRQWREEILSEVWRRLRADPRYRETSLRAFHDHVILDLPAEDVARNHGLTVNNIYQIKNRVMNRMRQIAAVLMEEIGEIE